MVNEGVYYNVYKNGKYFEVVRAEDIEKYLDDPCITLELTSVDGWKMDDYTASRKVIDLATYWYADPELYLKGVGERVDECFNRAYATVQKQNPEVDLTPAQLYRAMRAYLEPIEEHLAHLAELEEIERQDALLKVDIDNIEGKTRKQVIREEAKRQIQCEIQGIKHNIKSLENDTGDFKYVKMVSKWIKESTESIDRFADTMLQWSMQE